MIGLLRDRELGITSSAILAGIVLAYGVHYPADWDLTVERRTLLFVVVLFLYLVIAYRPRIGAGDGYSDPVKVPTSVPPVFSDLAQQAMGGNSAPSFVPAAQPAARPGGNGTSAYAKPKTKPGTFEWVVYEEIDTINQTLAAHKIDARVPFLPSGRIPKPFMVAPTSFIAYRLDLKPGQSIDKIVARSRELSEAITDRRGRTIAGYREQVDVRFRSFPLAIEVPHPDPAPLDWRTADLNLGAYQALAGISYDFQGERPVTINLAGGDHHILIAGMSGYGKSTMMRFVVSTLAYNNGPDKVKFLLADLKGKDLKVFKRLPHVIGYVDDADGLGAMIARANAIIDQRKEMDDYPDRVVFCIDELAEIREEDKPALARIMKLGREMHVNVIGGTQSPTGDEIGTEVNKAFTVRFVSRAVNANASAFYTTIKGAGADKIITPGDFLMTRGGGQIERLKAYSFDREDSRVLVGQIATKWPAVQHRQSSIRYEPDPVDDADSPASDPAGWGEPEPEYPIGYYRELTEADQVAVRAFARMDQFQYRGDPSVGKLAVHIFGSRSPDRDRQIQLALQGETING